MGSPVVNLVVFVRDPDVQPGVLRQLDHFERLPRDGGEAKALRGGEEEVVAMRIVDQILARVVERSLVGALATEIVTEVERTDDLIENLGVTLGGFGHGKRAKTLENLSYFRWGAVGPGSR